MVDAHCHLYEIPKIEWGDNGLEAMICAGASLESSKRSVELAEKYASVFATVGQHPESKEGFDKKALMELTKSKKTVAIGECGLDYNGDPPQGSPSGHPRGDSALQKELFKLNIELAKETKFPLVVHCRNAFEDVFDMLDYDKVQMHCFTGTREEMGECVRRGWYISFGGILTFKNSNYLRDVAKLVPEERVLLETDAPYLAPEPLRGQTNIPANVKIIARVMAQLRGVNYEEIERITTNNALRLFEKMILT